MTRGQLPERAEWRQFVLAHGWRSLANDMAAVTGQPVEDILELRRTGACKRLPRARRFAELFALWHGRAPLEGDWPKPRQVGSRGDYEWLGPEIALLASLVGRMGSAQVAQALTTRLRQVTGDPAAVRTRNAVQLRINRIGLESRDVLGGITTSQAAREAGSLAIVQHAVAKKQLRPTHVGRLLVIPHKDWEAWKAKRVLPPPGFVALSTLREPLAIRSDKLSEFARMGYVPTAVRCNPFGKGSSTRFGSWYLDAKQAARLVADRRAGRPMPWHGKPIADNLRATFRLWQQRKHPPCCKVCSEIWGTKGAPKSYDDYARRYPALAHGAKRHLTLPWNPGLTIPELAAKSGRSAGHVRRAIANGLLASRKEKGRTYITRTDATRWMARKCPAGDNAKSWISLQTARKQYLFTFTALREFIASGKLQSKKGTDGAARGVVYVSRHQCGQLREKIGYSHAEAARRAGVSVPRLRALLEGLNWRGAAAIPHVTVQAVIKRLESREGYTVQEAAQAVGASVPWVEERIADGTVKVSKAKWDRRRRYLSEPMLQRLRAALEIPKRRRLTSEWLHLSDAAQEAGVSAATLIKWAGDGQVQRQPSPTGCRYDRRSVRTRARRYWKTVRFHRATPPAWLLEEMGQGR